MSLYQLETIRSPKGSLNHYALFAEMYVKNIGGHFGFSNGAFYLKVRQWKRANYHGDGVEHCYHYSVRVSDQSAIEIYCTDSLNTENVTNNLIATYDESKGKIQFYIKSLVEDTNIYLTLLDESPMEILKIYKQPLFYTDIVPISTCVKLNQHPISYFNVSRRVTEENGVSIDTGFLSPKKYNNVYIEADIFLHNALGVTYKTKQIIVMEYESWQEAPIIKEISTIYADTTNTTGTTFEWVITNGKLHLSLNASTQTTDVKVLAMRKFI